MFILRLIHEISKSVSYVTTNGSELLSSF